MPKYLSQTVSGTDVSTFRCAFHEGGGALGRLESTRYEGFMRVSGVVRDNHQVLCTTHNLLVRLTLGSEWLLLCSPTNCKTMAPANSHTPALLICRNPTP